MQKDYGGIIDPGTEHLLGHLVAALRRQPPVVVLRHFSHRCTALAEVTRRSREALTPQCNQLLVLRCGLVTHLEKTLAHTRPSDPRTTLASSLRQLERHQSKTTDLTSRLDICLLYNSTRCAQRRPRHWCFPLDFCGVTLRRSHHLRSHVCIVKTSTLSLVIIVIVLINPVTVFTLRHCHRCSHTHLGLDIQSC